MVEDQIYRSEVPSIALAQVVQDRTERGLTVREYCEETGICENTYFYWQRKLRAAASTRAADMSIGNSLTPGAGQH